MEGKRDKDAVLQAIPMATARFVADSQWLVWDASNHRIGEGRTPEIAWSAALRYVLSHSLTAVK